jgi:CHAD domain-containing protein
MGQQFEFRLGAQEDVLRPRRFAPGQGQLPIVIEAGPAHARDHPLPAKARPAILPRDIAAEDAFRLTLLQCKWHIASNIPAIVDGRQTEGIHQMRVGFRRLRVALTSFGGDFRTPALESLGLRASKLAEKLAPARDLDVFVEELLEPAAEANGAMDAFALLRARAGEARRTAWDYAVAHVLGPSFAAFMNDLGEALDRRIWFEAAGRAHATKGHMAFEMPAREIAGRMLNHRLKVANKRGRHLKTLSDEQRHKFRISLKKLRYTCEFFAPLYGEDVVGPFQRKLSRMQDILGALNDVAVARDTLDKLIAAREGLPTAERADLSFAAGIVYGWHLDRAGHIWKKGKKRWKAFAKTQPFWEN